MQNVQGTKARLLSVARVKTNTMAQHLENNGSITASRASLRSDILGSKLGREPSLSNWGSERARTTSSRSKAMTIPIIVARIKMVSWKKAIVYWAIWVSLMVSAMLWWPL